MLKKLTPPPPLEPREFRSAEEIDSAITKLQRRIRELQELDIRASVLKDNGAVDVVRSDIRNSIREIFGENSPEFREHRAIDLWAGPLLMGMGDAAFIEGKERGRQHVTGILHGLIKRLEEKRLDMSAGATPAPSTYFDRLNLHPRIREVSHELFMDGHAWPAVFEAAKALLNYVKERSSRHDLDGAQLMRTVFSKNDPVLAFNDLANQTDLDEQEGMMHLFEGAALAIRNPGGHAFPEGPDQRALEYISFLSLLAYRVQEGTRRKKS